MPTRPPRAPAQQAETRASAKEYAVYVLALVRYSHATADLRPVLMAKIGDHCGGCERSKRFVRKERRAGYFQVPDGPSRIRQVSYQGRQGGVRNVMVRFDDPEARNVYRSGRVRPIPAAPGSVLHARLRWDAQREHWGIENYAVSWGHG